MMDKDNPEKPVLPPLSGDATKRMWAETTLTPAQPRKVEDDSDIPEITCEYCQSRVKIRKGGRCPVCHM